MEVKEIKKKLKKSLDKQRYQHTLGVMYTAGCLAMANGYSIEKAMLAGLLQRQAWCWLRKSMALRMRRYCMP